MKQQLFRRALLTTACVASLYLANAQDWNNWRGPNHNGTGTATDLPSEWSLEQNKNIKWQVPMPGPSGATPIVHGNRLFVSSSVKKSKELSATCIDRKTGKTLWTKIIGKDEKAKRGNTFATPSPVTDGTNVYFSFGEGTVVGLTMDGKELWKRNLVQDYGALSVQFKYSSSPLLHDNRLIYSVIIKEGDQKAYIIALNPKTGKNLWKTPRKPCHDGQAMEAYTTPTPYTLKGKTGIVAVGAGWVTCHEPASGKELWKFGYKENAPKNWRLVSSPVQAGNNIVFSLPYGGHMMAIACPGNDLKKEPVLKWEYKGSIPDVPTPAYKDGLLYVLDDKKRNISCLEAESGTLVWTESVPFKPGIFASPTVADGKIYCIGLRGEVAVYAEGRSAKLLGTCSTDEKTWSSPVAVGEQLFIRTPSKLICIGK